MIALLGCAVGAVGIDTPDTAAPAQDTAAPAQDTAPAAACGLEASLDAVNVTEGDTVSFTLDCAEGDREDFILNITAPSASMVLEDWSVTWPTGLADGGRYDVPVSVAATAGGLLEVINVTFWVADALGAPGNEPVVPEDYTEEWGIPVIHIEPEQPLGSEHVPARITFMGVGYDAELKIRGASSYYYPKNSYTLRFSNEDLDASAVGLGNKDHLVLITTFDDNSYVRQKMVYDTWRELAAYSDAERLTPRTFFAVVYLDGHYHGLYTACDRIDDHFVKEMGLSEDGNLYKAVNHEANFYFKSNLHDGYEKKEGSPEDGQPGAYDDLDALVSFTGTATPQSFIEQAEDWLPLEEFMDWFLLVHHFSAGDSAGKNSYIYNDPEQWRFRYAPWDFNHSLGQGWYTYRISADSDDDFQSANAIFNLIQSHPEADAALWDRYHDMLDDGPLELDVLLAKMDDYYALIQPSAERDWSVWGGEYSSYWGTSNTNDYLEEKAYLYQWVSDRQDAMLLAHP